MTQRITHSLRIIALPTNFIKFWWAFIFFIALMNVWRLVFLLSQFGFLQGSNWTLYAKSFLIGLRLDGMVASYLMLPLGILMMIKFSTGNELFYKYYSRAYIILSSLIISLINIIDIFAFQEFDTHLSFLTLRSYAIQKDSMAYIFEEYPVFPAIAILLLLTWGVFTLYRIADSAIQAKTTTPLNKVLGLTLTVIMLGGFIRGGWQERPIDWGFAMFSPDFIANQTALNSLFFLGRSVVQFSSESNAHELTQYYAPEEAFDTTRELLHDPLASFTDDSSMTRMRQVQPGEDYNVILVLLESHTAAFCGYLNSENKLVTPNLDRMAQEGLAFTNCYANGVRSAHGVSSVIMSWPNLPGLPLISRTESVNNAPSLGSALKAVGYNTMFLYGGDSQFDNMNGFLSANGFDQVLDIKDFSSAHAGTKWGIFDHTVFDRALEELDKSTPLHPMFLTLFTTSNHQPWSIPPEYEASIPSFPDTLYRQGDVHRSMAYVDQAMGEFMEKAAQHDWYDNSIFVFIADHGLTVHKSPLAKVQNAHIPFVIYAPGLSLEPRIIDKHVSQVDVAPTVLGLINYPLPYTFFGQNALTSVNGVACKIIGGEAFYLQDDYLYFERFGQEAKLFKIQNPLTDAFEQIPSDSSLFNTYQKNFRSYLQTGSDQFKAFGKRNN